MDTLLWILGLAVGLYLLVGVGWWTASTSSARRMLGLAREKQERIEDWEERGIGPDYGPLIRTREERDECLDDAREAAVEARQAPYWPVVVVLTAARALTAANREVAEIRTRTTELDPIQRADRIAALEAESEELRRQQETDQPV